MHPPEIVTIVRDIAHKRFLNSVAGKEIYEGLSTDEELKNGIKYWEKL